MILGFIEHDRGILNEASLEMLTLARGLADELDTPLEAVLIGEDALGLADTLPAYGVSTVHLAEHDRLNDYAPGAWAQSIVQLIDTSEPDAVVAPGTDRGHEVLAHIAARTGLPMAANCTDVHPGGASADVYTVTRQRWGGSLLEDAELGGSTKLFSVAAHLMPAEEARVAGDLTVQRFTPTLDDADFRVRVSAREETAQEGVSLTDANVVIGGGRGMGSAENFAILEELADLLGGAVGGSRVATNNGWRPHSDQIGQTGNRIAPDIYIACGISGAIQHMVGCKGAKNILAINIDDEAPIIDKADYAIIGDLHEIVPALTEAVRNAKQG